MSLEQVLIDLTIALVCFGAMGSVYLIYNRYFSMYRIKLYNEERIDDFMHMLCDSINKVRRTERLPMTALQNAASITAGLNFPPYVDVIVEPDTRYDNEYSLTFTSKEEAEIRARRLCVLRQPSTGLKVYVFV